MREYPKIQTAYQMDIQLEKQIFDSVLHNCIFDEIVSEWHY